MKFTAWVAAVSLVLGSALFAGCNRDSASGGSSASKNTRPSGMSGTTGQTPRGGAAGQQSEGSTTPGAAPKRPASPAPSGSK